MTKSAKFLVVLVLVVCICCTIPAFAETEETTTPVTIRLSLKHYLSGASCNVILSRFANATDTTPIDPGNAPTNLSILRGRNWQLTLNLPDGFYEVSSVTMTGNWDNPVFGRSPRFEVKGDSVTVYVAVENLNSPAPMPENWLVYGEDNQNFHIWAETTSDDNTTGPTPGVDTTTPPSVDTGDLPDVPTGDTDIITMTPDTSVVVPDTSDETTQTPEEPLLRKIGNYFYPILALVLLCASLFLYIWTQKRGSK